MENPRLQTIEASYYSVLRYALGELAGIELEIADEDLSYELEKLSIWNLNPTNRWFISGISGAGKSTTIKILSENDFIRIPNITTRTMRPGENPNDYIFVDEWIFNIWHEQGRIFQPHITNKVWHGMLMDDIDRIRIGTERLYADKSVKSVVSLVKQLPEDAQINLVYILAPTFKVLYQRIANREKSLQSLTEDDILDRFEEEIPQIKYTLGHPYTFVVNDDSSRVEKLILQNI